MTAANVINIDRKITLGVIHCSATQPTLNIGAKEIDKWHREFGWTRIGYHWVIRRDGTLEPGRPEKAVGAHAFGWNANSVAVCLVGGVDAKNHPDPNFTEQQRDTLEDLVLNGWMNRYPGIKIVGHHDLPGHAKACPCFDVAEWLESGRFIKAVRATIHDVKRR